MLIDGSLDGVRLLPEDLAREVFRDQLAQRIPFPERFSSTAPEVSADLHVGSGCRWGCGVLLNTRPWPGRRAAGSGAWGGMFNTYFWVDPSTRVAGGIYSQYFPFVDPAMMRIYAEFERGVYSLLRGPGDKDQV
jgi:CubicO group peptidase (beta-lactamase class C family)